MFGLQGQFWNSAGHADQFGSPDSRLGLSDFSPVLPTWIPPNNAAVQPFDGMPRLHPGQLEAQLLSVARALDQQIASLISKLDNADQSEGDMLATQSNLHRLNRMYDMLSQTLYALQESEKVPVLNMSSPHFPAHAG